MAQHVVTWLVGPATGAILVAVAGCMPVAEVVPAAQDGLTVETTRNRVIGQFDANLITEDEVRARFESECERIGGVLLGFEARETDEPGIFVAQGPCNTGRLS